MDPASVGHGVIQGGWTYVIAAYSVSWLLLAAFTLFAVSKARKEDL